MAGITVAQRSDGSYLVGAVGLTGANFTTASQIVVDTVSAGGVAAAASAVTVSAAFTGLSGVAADGLNGFIYFDGPDGAAPTHTVAVARVTVAGALDGGFGTAGVASAGGRCRQHGELRAARGSVGRQAGRPSRRHQGR